MPDHLTSTDPLSHKPTKNSEPLPNGQATTSNPLSLGKKLILDNAHSAVVQPYSLNCAMLSAENLPLVLQGLCPAYTISAAKNDPINLKLLQPHCLPTDLLNNVSNTISSLDIENLYFDLEVPHFDFESPLTKRASKIINNTTIISPVIFSALRQLVQRNHAKEIYFIVPDQFNISTPLLTEEQEKLLIVDLEKNHNLISLSLLQRSIAISSLDRFNKYEIKWYNPDGIKILTSDDFRKKQLAHPANNQSPKSPISASFTEFETAIKGGDINQAITSLIEFYKNNDDIFKTESYVKNINIYFCQLIMHRNLTKQDLQLLIPYKTKIITYLLQIRKNILIPIGDTSYPFAELLELFTSSGNAYEFFGGSTNQIDKLWFKNNSVRNNSSDSLDTLGKLLRQFYARDAKISLQTTSQITEDQLILRTNKLISGRISELEISLQAEIEKSPFEIEAARKLLSIIDKTYGHATEQIKRGFFLASARKHINSLPNKEEKPATAMSISANPGEPSIEDKATQALIGAIESTKPDNDENKKIGFEKIIPVFLALIERLTPNTAPYTALRKFRMKIFDYLTYGLTSNQSSLQPLSGNPIPREILLAQLLDPENPAGKFFVRESPKTFLDSLSTHLRNPVNYIDEFWKIRYSLLPNVLSSSPPAKNAADLSSARLLTK